MEDKFPMNLQFFAENPAAGADDASDTGAPDEAESIAQGETNSDTEQPKTFTQEEVDKMVQKRMARYDRDHKKEIDEAKSEAVKYAKMNKDEKQKHDLEKAQADAKKAREDLARYQLRDVTRQAIVDGGYTPTDEDLDMIVAGDAETTQSNTQAFLSMVERIRSSVRDDLLKGNTPKGGGMPVKKQKSLNEMSLMERVQLRNEDPKAYQDLVKNSGY